MQNLLTNLNPVVRAIARSHLFQGVESLLQEAWGASLCCTQHFQCYTFLFQGSLTFQPFLDFLETLEAATDSALLAN